MQLIILASGKGSRLKNKTAKKPKCLVEVNKKPIIDYMSNLINSYKTIIVTGFKSHLLEKKFGKEKIFYNKDFSTTNMVHSLFSVNKKIKKDLIVVYSDIIFNSKIITDLKKINSTIIPVKKNWLKIWKLRMSSKKILDDAEDLKIKNKRIVSIGEKITSNKFPKYQFMGIIKIKLKDYRKMFKVYRKLKNKKIDFTNFLNILIKRYNFNIFAKPTSNFWLEIDSDADLKAAKFLLNEKK